MQETIIQIIEDVTGERVEADTDLIEEGILDSFDMVSLVLELQEAFDVKIEVAKLVPEHFQDVNAIERLIREL